MMFRSHPRSARRGPGRTLLYANAAAQDSFCAGTTCTITEIYDQSGHGNNLTPGPAGGNGGADSPAIANALR
jgi:hypothetical protein